MEYLKLLKYIPLILFILPVGIGNATLVTQGVHVKGCGTVSPEAFELYQKGLLDENAGQSEQAIKKYTSSLAESPCVIDAYFYRGLLFSNLKKEKEAIKDFSVFLKYQPNSSETYTYRGNCYYKLKLFDNATQDYNKAIELDPNNVVAINNIALLKIHNFEWKSALEILNKAISLNPDYLNTRLSRAIIYRDGFKDYKKALADYNKAISLIELNKKKDADIYNLRGDVYHNLSNYKKAAVEAYFQRGVLFSDLKREKEAIKDFTIAIKYHPDFTNSYVDRGYSYYKLKLFDKAMKDYNKALTLDSKNVIAMNNIVLIKKRIMNGNPPLKLSTKLLP